MSPVGIESARTYRADIQGLRGVAVLLVVAYHADLGLPGGFLGVDVFFVVSGFVIGRLLHREIADTGTVRLRDFYARRVRRIMPALAVFLVLVLAATALTLNPDPLQHIALRTAVAAQAFVANVFLYRNTGYFDTSAALNPFLHLWSLSIEEQFYLVLPPLLVLAARRGRALPALVAVAVSSLTLALLTGTGVATLGLAAPERFAYFASPTRAWEFCAGAILAFSWHRVGGIGRRSATGAGLFGVLAVAGAVALVQPVGPYPVVASILAVAGVVALVVAGATGNAATTALSWRPLTIIGDWSYAWYLWHWPAIVIARVWWPTTSWIAPAVALVALVPAAVSSIWLERPVRVGPMSGTLVLQVLGVCVVVPLIASGALSYGLRTDLGLYFPDEWYHYTPAGLAGCVLLNRDIANTWADECETHTPGARGTVLVLGDQQADGIHSAVATAAPAIGLDTAVWARSECPFLGRTPTAYPRCDDWNDDALALVDDLDADVVVIANDAPSYVEPDSSVLLEGPDGDPAADRAEAVELYREGLDEMLDELTGRGVAVVVVSAVPDYGTSFPRDRVSLLRLGIVAPVFDRDDVERRRSDVLAAERAAVAGHRGTTLLDPVPVLCDAACTPVRFGIWMYSGPSQLTLEGAALLTDAVGDAIRSVRN